MPLSDCPVLETSTAAGTGADAKDRVSASPSDKSSACCFAVAGAARLNNNGRHSRPDHRLKASRDKAGRRKTKPEPGGSAAKFSRRRKENTSPGLANRPPRRSDTDPPLRDGIAPPPPRKVLAPRGPDEFFLSCSGKKGMAEVFLCSWFDGVGGFQTSFAEVNES